MKTSKLFSGVIALTIPVVLFAGCASQNTAELDALKQENETLKQQNSQLQSQLDKLTEEMDKTEVASADDTSTSQEVSFEDVDAEVPNHQYIQDLAKLRVFKNVDNTFEPYKPISRGEYITWLYFAYNAMRSDDKKVKLAPATELTFQDIDSEHPSYKYVQAFVNAGYSVGYDEKTFAPDKAITREEMITIKHGIDGGKKFALNQLDFADASKVDKRFVPSIYAELVYNDKGPKGGNLVRSFGPFKSFGPKKEVMRYEAAGSLWQTDHHGNYTALTALKQ